MKIYIEDSELSFLISSGKSRKYRQVPDKMHLVNELQYLYNILSVVEDLSELSFYKSIYNSTLIPAGDESFLLPIDGKSGMALRLQYSDDTVTFLALQNNNNYEQGR